MRSSLHVAEQLTERFTTWHDLHANIAKVRQGSAAGSARTDDEITAIANHMKAEYERRASSPIAELLLSTMLDIYLLKRQRLFQE